MTQRRRVPKAEKEEIAKNGKCYLCSDLGLDHAGFHGYALRDIHLDHYQDPFSAVGAKEGAAGSDTLPLHAATGGLTPDDDGFESSNKRNCHRLKGNSFNSKSSYVKAMRARLEARHASFVDDVYENKERKASDNQFKLPVSWGNAQSDTARFRDKEYLVITEERTTERWRRFLVSLPGSKLFTDDTSQVRPATKKTINKMIETFLVEDFPTFAPINARIDKCGHVVIFDGNHRATAHSLAFGIESEMPVMIWDIEPGQGCALRTTATAG